MGTSITEQENAAAVHSSLRPPRRLLFGPGPTMVHPRVYEAMSKPIVGHLDPFFFQVMQDVQRLLKAAFGTRDGVTLAISGTGSSGMEASVSNFVEPGSRVAIFANGYFCDRITEMAKRQGGNVVRLEKQWGETFSDDEATSFIAREKPQTVAFVHAETSSGALQSGRTICEAAHKIGALVIADCVTSLGAMPIEFDKTGIDIAYSCTQKGLSCPPGLSPIALSSRAMDFLNHRSWTSHSWYLDLRLIHDYVAVSHRYHHTAPISNFYGLREALELAEEEGFQNRWERHRRAHRMFIDGIRALGLRMHVADESRQIWNLSTVAVPSGIDEAAVRKYLLEKEDLEIQGGFGPLAGKVWRIGIMGPLATDENVRLLLSSLEKALLEQGYRGH
jgi:alanine-glyoxylate transaminase/serine-glyoxylate transaminase/serine-pyruvate transaminase